MNNEAKASCKHKYIVGYSLRMPQPFFRSLPCDSCGCRIKLSFPWRILYVFIAIIVKEREQTLNKNAYSLFVP